MITVCGIQQTACVVEGSIFMCTERNEPEMVLYDEERKADTENILSGMLIRIH